MKLEYCFHFFFMETTLSDSDANLRSILSVEVEDPT